MSKITIELVADPRDVLQGLNYALDNDKYVKHLLHVAKAGFQHIMVGSLVNAKLVPAMADSEVRAQNFFKKYPNADLKRQILVFRPDGKYMERAILLIEEGAVNSIAYTHSLSDDFLFNNNGIGRKEFGHYDPQNREKTIELSREIVKEFVVKAKELSISLDIHMSKVTHLLSDEEQQQKLIEEITQEFVLLAEITKEIPGRIMFSDTSGEATPQNMKLLMKSIVAAKTKFSITKNIGLHLHTNPENTSDLAELILSSLAPFKETNKDEHISFDIGFGGIGGCPFDSKNPKANLQVSNILQIQKEITDFGVEIVPTLQKKDVDLLDNEIKEFVDQPTDKKIKTIFEKFRDLFIGW